MTGRWLLNKSAHEVWERCCRPHDLVARVPDILSLSEREPGRFNLVVNVDTGLGWSVYEFTAEVDYGPGPQSVTIHAVGVSRQQLVEFTTRLTVSEADGGAAVDFTVDAVARGGLASVAQRTVQWVVAQQVQSWIAQVIGAPLQVSA